MKFFIPDQSDELIQDQAEHLKARNVRAIRRLEHRTPKSRFIVEVGQPRQEYPRKTGPRGGRIEGADYSALARSTGKPVQMILHSAGVIEVYSAPGDGWEHFSLVGLNELVDGQTEYFDPWE